MTPRTKPLLLLDVDGVLAPFGPTIKPTGFRQHTLHTELLGDHKVWLNSQHGDWLRPLQELFDFVWCSGWEDEAPQLLGPILGLAPAPVIHFNQRAVINLPLNKLPDVADFVGDRPLAWLDASLQEKDYRWASERDRTLLIAPEHNVGLLHEHIDRLQQFAADTFDPAQR